MNFVIHWNETAMGLHVFPIPIPPPTSLATRWIKIFVCIGEILYIKGFSIHPCSAHRWMGFTIMTTKTSIPPEHKPRSLVTLDTQISWSVHWTIISCEWQCFNIHSFSTLFPSLSMFLSHLSNQDNVSRKLLTASTILSSTC